MPHIHTEPGQHDATASGLIFRVDGVMPKVLLIRHKKYGMILQPGGHVELDETPWQCILRELKEETGYGPEQLELVQHPDSFRQKLQKSVAHPVPSILNTHQVSDGDHYHSDALYTFLTDEEPSYRVSPDESQDIKFYTKQEVEALDEYVLYPDARQFVMFMFDRLDSWDRMLIADFAA